MRKLGIIGGAAATMLGATIVLAASPAPAAVPPAAPATTPGAPAVTTPSAAAVTANPWSVAVQPMTLQGTATFVKYQDGAATLTMAMQGLDPMAGWTVTIVPGGTGRFDPRTVLFRWTKSDVDRLGNGTLSVRLTPAQYASIAHARTRDGLVILVSDGTREALATFAKA